MRTASQLSLALLALVVFGASAAQAQISNNASITATADVQTPINVVGAQQLNFGNVFPGANKTVLTSDLANAGRFEISGQASAPVTLSFTLPATLSSGLNSMPIDSYSALRADDATQSGVSIAFGPGPSNAATLSAAGALYVWVGARVTPASTQPEGTY
jgi:hypothetical protein